MRFCEHCGEELTPGQQFCTVYGTVLDAEGDTQSSPDPGAGVDDPTRLRSSQGPARSGPSAGSAAGAAASRPRAARSLAVALAVGVGALAVVAVVGGFMVLRGAGDSGDAEPGSVTGAGASGVAAQTTDLRSVDWSNATIPQASASGGGATGPCLASDVLVSSGRATASSPAAAEGLVDVQLAQVAYADLDDDGRDEAAVLVRCRPADESGDWAWFDLQVLTLDESSTPTPLPQQDQGVVYRSVTAQTGAQASGVAEGEPVFDGQLLLTGDGDEFRLEGDVAWPTAADARATFESRVKGTTSGQVDVVVATDVAAPPAQAEPPAEEQAAPPAVVGATRSDAYDTVQSLYYALSSKDWGTSSALISDSVADQFSPDFFDQFESVTVYDLEVCGEGFYEFAYECPVDPDGQVTLMGRNTFVRPRQITEEIRLWSVNRVDGSPIVTGSELVKVVRVYDR